MKHGAALVLALLLGACASTPAPFLPPPGKRLFALMETADEPHEPSTWPVPPAAVVGYTDLRKLHGIEPGYDSRHGRLDLGAMARRWPDSALVIGLHVAGDLQAIASGERDGQIDRLAALLAPFRRPLFIRFGYEIDGAWNRHDPEMFIRAWRHFRARLRERGLPFAMIWQLAADCGPTHLGRPVEDWYPGDADVDWVGLSYFRPHACGGLVAEGAIAFARRHGKPVIIAEATPRGFDLRGKRYGETGQHFTPVTSEQIWQDWYQPLFDFVDRHADAVRMVTYINYEWDSHPAWRRPGEYWGDARVEHDPLVLQRWRERMRDPAWLPGDPALFPALRYEP